MAVERREKKGRKEERGGHLYTPWLVIDCWSLENLSCDNEERHCVNCIVQILCDCDNRILDRFFLCHCVRTMHCCDSLPLSDNMVLSFPLAKVRHSSNIPFHFISIQ